MKVVWILFLGLISFSVAADDSENRIERHNNAIDILSKTHFFRNGKGMVLSPDVTKVFKHAAKVFGLPRWEDKGNGDNPLLSFSDRWGLNVVDGKIKGFFNVEYKKMDVGVLACTICHSGKAAGQYIIGLGNKNIDVGKLAKDVYRAEKIWQVLTALKKKSKEYKEMEKGALDFSGRLSNDRYNNLTQGLVPVSMIRQWFYRQAGKDLPKNEPRGTIKVPHFWGYGKKRFIGQFSDGFGDGNHAGWGLAVELAGTQTPENIRALMPKIEMAEDLLHDILPPKYPFAIKQEMASRGKEVYQMACQKCHGTYERDAKGIPIFKEPKHVRIEIVKTDDDRLKGNTEEFFRLVDNNPLPDYIRRTNLPPGFFAPRLESVWARFPYLHNGSIPNIMALLTEPSKRPTFWSLKEAGERHRFDENLMGYTMPSEREKRTMLKNAKKGARDIYWTERVGQSSKGHWFRGMKTLTQDQKRDLIEYLKTL